MINGGRTWRVSCQRRIEYEIVVSPCLLHPDNEALLSVGRREHARRFVVVDENVHGHWAAEIRDYFERHRVDARIVPCAAGEANKSVDAYLRLLRELDSFPIHRRDEPLIAIGGGVLTDLVGFVAGSYRRGVPHIKVPTTLMGYVDASVGVKTGINFNGHKNRLGSFEPPARVLLDKSFLKTLPARHLRSGVGEILKLAIIKDAELFQLLERHGAQSVASLFQDAPGASILDRAIAGMLEELQPNLFEEELARKVDFGHTFSYGLETHGGVDLLHGEAVLLDIALSVWIAHARGLLSEIERARVFRLLSGLGMELATSALDADLLWESLEERTFHRNGLQRVPLPRGIGGCTFVNDISREDIESAVGKLLSSRERMGTHAT